MSSRARGGTLLRRAACLAALVGCLWGAAAAAPAAGYAASASSAAVAASAPPEPDATTTAPADPSPDVTPEPEPTETVAPETSAAPAPTEPETTAPATVPAEETRQPDDPAATENPATIPGFDPVDPAIAATGGSSISWLIAAGVLIAGAIALLAMRRRGEPDITSSALVAATTGSSPVVPTSPPDSAATLAATEAVGEAMIDAGYSVVTVRQVLDDVARVNGLPASEVVVFPTALLVSARGEGELRTGAVSSGESKLLLSQIDHLQHTVDAARTGVLDPPSTLERIRQMRGLPAPFGPVQRVLGYAFLSVGLAVLLGASWFGIALSAVLGVGVGTLLLVGERVPRRYGALLTVAISFGVSLTIFLLLRGPFGPDILPALIAPLVVLLPGALLTTAVIELSTGQMISGAGRLAAGAMQLVLLAAGIVAAGALVGVPGFDFQEQPEALGPIAPWIAVAVFGVGIVAHQCAPRRSLGWILLVLYIAYAAQVLGDIFLGGVLSALVG
ncbi:MAG TPA: threonine/serine exporter family protein, partial [Solirubrobacteraceae bacterium]|nr:threonine/serine exporter family protein [Solirubrobacteraceae bacterium]